MNIRIQRPPFETAGLIALSLRLVIGWTYFSALWRRMVLANKLDPEAIGYVGEKFNHFLPNALGIKPLIEYMVTHPEVLEVSMITFTIVEGIVGLFLMLGLFTRVAAIGVFGLAMGILLGSGWLGTTCLDEWQIGVLGLAAGFTIFLSGSGPFSVDQYLRRKAIGRKKWFSWAGSGSFPVANLKAVALVGALFLFSVTLFTNQYFHGGVFGTLHNKSVRPKLEISEARLTNDQLHFQVFRTEGVDVYGSFLIGISLMDAAGNTIYHLKSEDLAGLDPDFIENRYISKVTPGVHSLIIPLGARAKISLPVADPLIEAGKNYQLILTDISGLTWSAPVSL